jgi:hypothetical protein
VSGVAILNYESTSSTEWRRDTFELRIRLDIATRFLTLPSPPPGQIYALQVNLNVVYVALNSIANLGTSSNPGYAVDRFYLTQEAFQNPIPFPGPLPIGIDVAVRGSQGILFRVGYHVTLIAPITTIMVPT